MIVIQYCDYCIVIDIIENSSANVAQWLTHLICNEKIPGSTPGISFWCNASEESSTTKHWFYSYNWQFYTTRNNITPTLTLVFYGTSRYLHTYCTQLKYYNTYYNTHWYATTTALTIVKNQKWLSSPLVLLYRINQAATFTWDRVTASIWTKLESRKLI